MTKAHKPMVKLLTSAIVGILASSAAQAAGFSLYGEGNGINASNFAAGSAAEVHDASTAWYNPAGLALIHEEQAVAAGTAIAASGRASGTANFSAVTAAGVPFATYSQSFNGLQGGKNAFVPAFHYAHPISANAAFGLSVVAPFGLATKWAEDSAVRYNATNSELLTINVSPAVGGKIYDNVAIGAGLDVQYSAVTFNKVLGSPIFAVNAPPALEGPFPPEYYDSTSRNEGDSVGVGFHAGILTMFNQNHTRVGLNYQSRMKHKFNGHSTLQGRLANASFLVVKPNPNAVFRTNDLYTNNIDFPAVTTLSAYHDIDDAWAVMGSAVYTQWSSIKQIVLNNVAGPTTLKLQSTSNLFYKDAWRLAGGVNYRVNPEFTVRFGGGYDETPTNDTDRDMRLPDADRYTLAIGGEYQVRDDLSVGFGWTHFFINKGRVNKNEGVFSAAGSAANGSGVNNIVATADVNADLFGAQVVWMMDKHLTPTK